MDKLPFYKMSGAGNDFIVIDNRNHILEEPAMENFIIKVCARKMSAGADGLILVENSETADFKWRFFNSDGKPADMCGNGARCAARFAYENKIAGKTLSFETAAGLVEAEISKTLVKLKMPDPGPPLFDAPLQTDDWAMMYDFIDTGVPHAIIRVEDIESVDVTGIGRKIRFHEAFAPKGTNVNFISYEGDGDVSMRTYERGVEDETLACGTGAIASALVKSHKTGQNSPIRVIARSGSVLTIHFKREENRFYDIVMEGDARIVYAGVLWEEAWRY